MKYLASYCLLSMAGKTDIQESDLLKVLKEIGAEGQTEKAALVCKQLSGKCVTELCREGQSKISSLSVGAGSAPVAKAAVAQANNEAQKEKTVEEEENVDIGDLFG